MAGCCQQVCQWQSITKEHLQDRVDLPDIFPSEVLKDPSSLEGQGLPGWPAGTFEQCPPV